MIPIPIEVLTFGAELSSFKSTNVIVSLMSPLIAL